MDFLTNFIKCVIFLKTLLSLDLVSGLMKNAQNEAGVGPFYSRNLNKRARSYSGLHTYLFFWISQAFCQVSRPNLGFIF